MNVVRELLCGFVKVMTAPNIPVLETSAIS